jgi:predicted transcriptional regulator
VIKGSIPNEDFPNLGGNEQFSDEHLKTIQYL